MGTHPTIARDSWNNNVLFTAAVLLLLASMALTGCSAQPATIAAVEPTATAHAPLPTDTPKPTVWATPAALDFPLPPPKHVEIEPAEDEGCVTCHTSEATLKSLAKQDEEPKVESVGEG